jgi:hypothetical protein
MRTRLTAEVLEARDVPAVTIQFDYSFDANGFFNDPARRAILEQAATDTAGRIDTPLAAVTPGGGNAWTVRFVDPSTGEVAAVGNPTLGANTLRVYVGGRDLPDLGVGETVSGTASSSGSAEWRALVRGRTPIGASSWGSSVAFDTDTPWHFGSSAAGIPRDQIDFYSVAVHELGHVLGIGASDRWDALTSGNTFVGPNAQAVFGGPVPLGDDAHWADDVTIDGQPVSLDPTVSDGVRVPFSVLEFAALIDIGWTIGGATGPGAASTTQPNPTPWAGTWTSLSGSQVVTLTGAEGGAAQAFTVNASGALTAIGPKITPFVGGGSVIRSVVADFNGDGTPDLAFGAGTGATAAVRVLNGRTGRDLVGTTEVLNGFAGGVYLAAGDVNGDGRAELAVSADAGGGLRVTLFRVGRVLEAAANFLAFDDASFRGGSRIAMGDVNNDGAADLIVGAGIGGGPRVGVYDGDTLLSGSPRSLVPDFFALDPNLRSGVFVTVADLTGDDFADVMYSTGNTGGPRVRVVSGKVLTDNPGQNAFTLPAIGDFFALDENDRSGLRLAARDLTDDGRAELVAASGSSAVRVRVISLAEIQTGNPVGPLQDPFGGLIPLDGIYVG